MPLLPFRLTLHPIFFKKLIKSIISGSIAQFLNFVSPLAKQAPIKTFSVAPTAVTQRVAATPNSTGHIASSATPISGAAPTAAPTAAAPSAPTGIIDESTGIDVGLARKIREQQALGAGNILTKTGATGVDPATGRFDPSKVEMLYDPVKYSIQEGELRTTDDKLIDPAALPSPDDISGVQQTSVAPQDASQRTPVGSHQPDDELGHLEIESQPRLTFQF